MFDTIREYGIRYKDKFLYDYMSSNDSKILCMQGIVKEFSGTRVLDEVDFDVRGGEVHALIGENGAGKSKDL
jgi:ABC-type uncharacterized transport system ATPase subunit